MCVEGTLQRSTAAAAKQDISALHIVLERMMPPEGIYCLKFPLMPPSEYFRCCECFVATLSIALELWTNGRL